ncbi:MAG: RNA-binding S4 domain-containing protein [Clostridia bacterium]|nr:RNA-binding S4 domain-containing protein [Clostridia bacterium]
MDVPVQSAPIKLDSFLKLAGAVRTGGEGKRLVQSGRVRVNGRIEGRRGRQLWPGDVVAVEGVGLFRVAGAETPGNG